MITWKSFKPNKTSIKSLLTKAKAKGWDGDSDLIILRGSHTEIAKYIKSNIELSGPQLVYDEGSFWQYKNTHWEKCEDHLCRKWVQDLDGLPIDKKKVITANKSLIDGALNELAAICSQPYFFQECKIGINCLSGFIHITDESNIELLDHAPEHRQRHTIEAKWSPNNKELIVGYLKMFLEGCFKDETDKNGIIKLLFQILGVGCCNYSTKLSSPKAFVLFGPTAMNGKSQFLNLFKAFLPVSSYASIPPSSFKQEQYLADLVGKSINVTDELSGTKAIVSDKMKSVITGDMISAKKIYQPVFNFRPLALHIFASNELPNFEGGVDAGIERRLKVIPFKRSIPKEEQIPQIAEKIVNDGSDVLLYLAVNGLKEVIEKGDYEIPNVVDSETKEWFKLADVILEWFNEGELDNKIISKKRYHFKTAYQDFIEWMKRRNHCAFYPTNQRFNSRIRALANHSKYIVAKDSKGFYVTENILL